ncbi:MAG: peptidase [Phenylobacterium sp.]|nr:peptidase [Phenylobacterium sp.]
MKFALTLPMCVIALGAASAAFAAPAGKYAGQELAPQAKISLSQAQAIAMKARPGKITDKELEKEGGGSGLRYSFDITSQTVKYEVGVDAQTGKVLENKREGPHPD